MNNNKATVYRFLKGFKNMVNIMGKVYISDKEAAVRYGYSQGWFQKMRHEKAGPPFVKLRGKGKVYYAMEETDKWFKDNMMVI